MIAQLLDAVRGYLYKIIAAVIVLLIGFVFGILAKKLIRRLLREVELNKIMRKVNVHYDLEKWTGSVVSYVIYLVTFVLFLDQLGIRSVVILLLLSAVLTLLVLTSVVGLKDVIPNVVGWLYLQKKGSFIKEGKTIDIKEISGIIERIGYLETEIKTEHGDLLYVPNALFLKSKYQVKQ